MNSISEKIFDMYKVLDLIYDYYESNNQLEKYYSEIERIFIYNCFFMIHKLSGSNYNEKEVKELQVIYFLKEHFKNWNKNPYLRKEKLLSKLHIRIMNYKGILPVYNFLRGIFK